MTAEETPPRPGSSIDLSRRMDRMEQNHEQLVKEVAGLTSTIARVELNQTHAEELNKLRFGALDVSVSNLGTKLDAFMARINALISGEVRLPQNDALMKDWRDWRADTEGRLDEQAVLNGQVRLLGRLAVLLVSGNVVALVVGVAAILK